MPPKRQAANSTNRAVIRNIPLSVDHFRPVTMTSMADGTFQAGFQELCRGSARLQTQLARQLKKAATQCACCATAETESKRTMTNFYDRPPR